MAVCMCEGASEQGSGQGTSLTALLLRSLTFTLAPYPQTGKDWRRLIDLMAPPQVKMNPSADIDSSDNGETQAVLYDSDILSQRGGQP